MENYYYTVLTKIENIPPLFLNVLRDEYFDKTIIIEENGKNGDNPHYNLVYQVKERHLNNWSKNHKTILRKLYDQKFLKSLQNDSYLIKTKKSSSPENVIGGYILKEEGYKIIYNDFSEIEMTEFKRLALIDYSPQKKSKNIFDFVDNKIMIHIDPKMFKTPEKLINFAFAKMFRDKDLESVYYYKQRKAILDIVRANMGRDDEVKLFSMFD